MFQYGKNLFRMKDMNISVQSGGIIRFWGYEEGYRMIREAGFDGRSWRSFIKTD